MDRMRCHDAAMSRIDLSRIDTEARNPHSQQLDALSTRDLVAVMNDEDANVHQAVRAQLDAIAAAIDAIAARMHKGGRLVYCGAGTSGRLGVLDAAECPPTFSASPAQVIGLIAGGPGAFLKAIEGAEDDAALGARDLQALSLGPKDSVVGWRSRLSTSSRYTADGKSSAPLTKKNSTSWSSTSHPIATATSPREMTSCCASSRNSERCSAVTSGKSGNS